MPDPTHIETLQAQRALEALRAHIPRLTTRTIIMQRLLEEFDPRASDAERTYPELLLRIRTLMDRELQRDGQPFP